jgi:hypothetical protein
MSSWRDEAHSSRSSSYPTSSTASRYPYWEMSLTVKLRAGSTGGLRQGTGTSTGCDGRRGVRQSRLIGARGGGTCSGRSALTICSRAGAVQANQGRHLGNQVRRSFIDQENLTVTQSPMSLPCTCQGGVQYITPRRLGVIWRSDARHDRSVKHSRRSDNRFCNRADVVDHLQTGQARRQDACAGAVPAI